MLSLEGFKDLSALMAAGSDRALSGFTRSNVALTRCGLLAHPVTFADRSSLRSLSGHRPRISYPASPLANNLISPHASNKVPSRSMACMMTARRRASATRAFRSPRRLAIFIAQSNRFLLIDDVWGRGQSRHRQCVIVGSGGLHQRQRQKQQTFAHRHRGCS